VYYRVVYYLLFHFKLFSLARSGLFTLSHFSDGIQQGSTEDHEHSCNTQCGSRVLPNVKGHHALDGRLGRSRNVVRQGTGGLDLHDGDDTDRKSKTSGDQHGTPKEGRDHLLANGIENGSRFKVRHEGHEQDTRVDVVVKGQFPVIVVHGRQDLFGKDGIETDKEGGANAERRPNDGEVDFSLGSHEETGNDNDQTDAGAGGGRASENDLAQTYVEDNGQGSCDVVKGNLDVFQAEIVEGDHSHENNGQRQNLFANVGIVFRLGELRKESLSARVSLAISAAADDWERIGLLLDRFGDFSGDPTNKSRDDALEPRNEERGIDRNGLAGHKNLVQVDHRNGNAPVGGHHGGDVFRVFTHFALLFRNRIVYYGLLG